jgi:hypothetical protein
MTYFLSTVNLLKQPLILTGLFFQICWKCKILKQFLKNVSKLRGKKPMYSTEFEVGEVFLTKPCGTAKVFENIFSLFLVVFW